MRYQGMMGSLLIVVPVLTMCGGSSDKTCVTGTSIACAGNGGCSGFQVCNANGAYDPCVCGDGGTTDAGDSSTNDAPSSDVVVSDAPQDSQGNWTPAQLSGLSLWLDDTVGLVQDSQKVGYIKHWADQSGNGNDATGGCGVGNCGEPGYDQGAIHGHDAIICTGTMEIADASSLQFGLGDFAIAMVTKLNVPQVNVVGYLWRKFDQNSDGTNIGVPYNTQNIVLQDYNKTVTVDLSSYLNKWEIVLARGPALNLKIGADSYSGPSVTNDASGVGIDALICQMNSPNVEIAEVIVVKGTLSTNDEANLHGYFSTKFALP